MCTAKFRGLCNKSCSDKCQRLVFTKDVQICALKAIGRSVNLKIVTIFSLIILGIGDLKAIETCALKYTEFFAPKTVGVPTGRCRYLQGIQKFPIVRGSKNSIFSVSIIIIESA